jgi:AcrR family transcriptional regulator
MTNTEIIQAAFKVWGREFYLTTSLSQVALELGVSKPALYRHFRNKQALLDAMTVHFFDDFTVFIRPGYEKALQEGGRKGVFTLIRAFAEYYARNVYVFVFSLIRLYEHRIGKGDWTEEMKARGLDMGEFHRKVEKNYVFHPLVMNMIFTTLTFYMAVFHKRAKSFTNTPSDEEISKRIDTINEIIERGFGYIFKEIDTLDYGGLENRVEGTVKNLEDDPLLRAVAAAAAEAGPWEASMEQVARRSGLSKSGLYGHFKSKQDMLHRLFMTEFMRIIDFARQGMGQSEVQHEKLYLGIFSIAVYLRSKPDILVAMDWVRTRRHDFVKTGEKNGTNCDETEWEDGPPPEFPKLFEDFEIKPLQSGEISGGDGKKLICHWILFLVINILMRPGETKTLKNEDIRFLYRFITLGIKGFEK